MCPGPVTGSVALIGETVKPQKLWNWQAIFCHSLLSERVSAPATGPVQAERSEPEGSLDGWRRRGTTEPERMAEVDIQAAFVWYLNSVCTAMAQTKPSSSRPMAATIWGLFLPRAASFL